MQQKPQSIPNPAGLNNTKGSSTLSSDQDKSKDAHPKRKHKSSADRESGESTSGQSNDLKDEIHAMSCLMVKGRTRQPIVSDKTTKAHRSRDPGCDPAGWEHFKSKLTSCSKCKRSFFPYRVAAHEKLCTDFRPNQPQQVAPNHSISKQSLKSQNKS
jgi:hypothetical protein